MLGPQIQQLTTASTNCPQEDYPVHSRVHPLKVGNDYGIACWAKREDELGFLLSGSKVRKYRSLVAALKSRGCKKAGLIGSQFSNHVLGLSSLLIENAIEPTLFLLEAKEPPSVGNALFTQLLVPKKNIQLIPRERWAEVHDIATCWQQENHRFSACAIPEGGSIQDSIAGLVTLALDILKNEEDCKTPFGDILIDSGSGLTAASLIAAYGFLKKSSHIHICLAASKPDGFLQTLQLVKEALEELTGQAIDQMPKFTFYLPPTAKSFGSTNAKIFSTIKDIAQTEGVFLDPIYSSKLYLLLQQLLQQKTLQGPVLFIHSGGLLSLAGFQPQLCS